MATEAEQKNTRFLILKILSKAVYGSKRTYGHHCEVCQEIVDLIEDYENKKREK